uniref:Uncharacterized protein n=1 Tax=Oryza sativa subsp. japonica TaxID=39947 RepID=Q6ZB87_ORYSJ|nr:hypothetical protein [Oryza sativa Japonica Group]
MIRGHGAHGHIARRSTRTLQDYSGGAYSYCTGNIRLNPLVTTLTELSGGFVVVGCAEIRDPCRQ